jgi:hypothetical protein
LQSWGKRNGRPTATANGKTGAKSLTSSRPRPSAAPRKDARPDTRPAARSGRKTALTAGQAAGNSKRYGFTAPPKQGTKKRG